MVTSSPFPTCSSPSQLVSIDAGLKSSEKAWGSKKIINLTFLNLQCGFVKKEKP